MKLMTLMLVPALVLASGSLVSCSSRGPNTAATPAAKVTASATKPTVAPPSVAEMKPRDFPGIHNVVAYHDGYLSGSVPEGEAGFDTLASMGIKTIISVDGAVPEVDKANARGIKYIHLPIGYNGFDEQRKLELVRATRDAMASGPVYIHCHHGKHRSAGAAAAVAASLGWMTPDTGVARMKVSGTAPNYKGLYACASNSSLLPAETIDRVSPNFPSVSKTTNYVKAMVEIDETFEHLRDIEKAGWITPPDHPDLVPAAEAGRLADHFRTLSEGGRVKSSPPDFATMNDASQRHAQAIEDLLIAGGTKPDTQKLSATFKLLSQSCKDCHLKYRD